MTGRRSYTLSDMSELRPNTKFTPERQAVFLAALAKTGEIVASAALAGVARHTVYDRMKADPDFAAACKHARAVLLSRLVAVAEKLAIEGLVEEQFDRNGKKIGEKRKYSERVLLRWLARAAPEQWGDKIKIDQKVSAKVEHRTVKPRDLSPEGRAHVKGLLDSFRAARSDN